MERAQFTPHPKKNIIKNSGGHTESKTEVGVLCALKKNETHMYGHVLCGTVSVVCNDQRGSVSRLDTNNAWTRQHRNQRVPFMDYHIHMLRH